MTSLNRVIAEGRLIRMKWGQWASTDAQGRQWLCLYTAWLGDPEARPQTCPAETAPRWVAELVPWLDDVMSQRAWPGIVQRFARIAGQLGRLQGEASVRADYAARAAGLQEVMRHTRTAEVLAACARVMALCEARAGGESVEIDIFAAAKKSVEPSAETWEVAAWAASWAAAAWEEAAVYVAWAGRAAAAQAVWADAAAAAADRLADAILTILERAVAA